MKIWVVKWARAFVVDGSSADAFAGCYNFFYSTKEEAIAAMTRCKDEFVRDILEAAEDPYSRAGIENSLHVYGSEAEEYYEIDFIAEDDTPVEIYVSIQELAPEE